jgi:Tfp pilus assembly protein PilF
LARALDLVGVGLHDRAHPLLERYVAEAPDDAEGWESLGLCTLAKGDAAAAHRMLCRAVLLDPTSPMHHWNLAAAAHRAGRMGGCHLALLAYLELTGDLGPAEAERRTRASRLIAEYERFARLEYPLVAPADLARTEELCARAAELLDENETERGAELLEQALALVPSHHPTHVQRARLDQHAATRRPKNRKPRRRARAPQSGSLVR